MIENYLNKIKKIGLNVLKEYKINIWKMKLGCLINVISKMQLNVLKKLMIQDLIQI